MKSILKKTIFTLLAIILIILLLFGYQDKEVSELTDKYAPSPSAFVEINGMNVHYRDEGNPKDSLPIVLIHGTGASLHTFDAWTTNLKVNRRVIRMDLPAFGLTGPFPDRIYSIENYVTFIEQFLASQNIKKCILGGNSLGGNIAWNYTVKNPSTVEKLILIDAAGYPFKPESMPIAFKLAKTPIINNLLTIITPRFMARASVENVYADKSKVTDEIAERYFDLTLRTGNRRALVDRMTQDIDTNNHQKIKEIQQPTLVLWGDQDKLIPLNNATRFHEDLPNSKLAILRNVGHVPMEESPEESLVIVLDFLKN